MYSFGMILYELVTRTTPFGNIKLADVPPQVSRFTEIQMAKKNNFQVISGVRPEIPSDCDPLLRNLMEQCWNGEPSQRPNAADVIDRCQKYDWKNLSKMSLPIPKVPETKPSKWKDFLCLSHFIFLSSNLIWFFTIFFFFFFFWIFRRHLPRYHQQKNGRQCSPIDGNPNFNVESQRKRIKFLTSISRFFFFTINCRSNMGNCIHLQRIL